MPITRGSAAFSFDAIPVAALLLELDGRISSANAATGRIVDRAPEALVGMMIHELAPGIGEHWDALLESARVHGQALDETRLDGASGRRDLQVVLSIIEVDGEPMVQAFAIDITARRAAEETARIARQVAEEAARARATADEKLAADQRLESLGLVAGGIAHDFNNLLVGVLAEASAAREDPSLAEGTREALRRIEAAARRMAQLTRQLLAYAGRAQFVIVPLGADALLNELREQLSRVVRPDVQLDISADAGTAVVDADPGLLRQVVLNLVENAAEACRGRVRVSTRVISRDGAPFWQLEVADDGVGIDTTTLAHIFEPFYSTKLGHHGLGLSAVHGIVRRLAGDVEVDTRVGEGSRFRVHVPIALGAEPAPRSHTDPMPSIARLTGMRALVVDDEPSVRATVRRLIERRGATVVVAADGLEAEARLRDERFNLVVSDVSMPGCTGYDVLVIARATQPGVRVVLMSGYTEKLRGEGSEEEADAFIEKPFTAKALDATIDEVLKGK